ncbi:RNA-guided endonuclease InsQ/TnpB family protein [Gloeothece verrucosa]|uniref:Transposase, IS605 OrfB family n=1 Tax=Gloeothece verrucosa (strain PCC 7822) TaxID=497965 RepID=E0UNZ3_GLOV7|nr:RNA-guided endonuclease TnpB family protein [Gloeothece verrucosa]ADN18673.1 transposase, IS605 OrfB family [Gloeothece verrucosa PCC 7822]
MYLGFKTQLKVTNSDTKTLLAKHAGVARHAWNWGLALTKEILDNNKNNPEAHIKFPTSIDLHKWLVALVKPEYSWYYEVSKCAPQYALKYLREAWGRCFTLKGGSPKFKKKNRDDSFTLDGAITVDNFQIKVPRIGWLKTYERLPQGVKPSSVTISRKADKWFISFKVEIEPKPTEKNFDVLGVDLGIASLATCSNGQVFSGVKAYKKLEKKLTKLQYHNRNKTLLSANWYKSQNRIALLHLRIANTRKDYIHKMTTSIAKNHSKVVIEDLNVKGMLKCGKLAKAISDGAFAEIKRQLVYKCELYGSELILADRWFPSSKTCCVCGSKKESLSLCERVFDCQECHNKIDRDLNAAINLRQCGLGVSPSRATAVAKLGQAVPEVTPVDKKTPKSLVEAGIRTLS